MSKIITFGDNIVVSDAITWPEHLAKHLEKDYINLATKECTNTLIVDTFFNNIYKISKGDIISLNFTYSNENIIDTLKAINLAISYLERHKMMYLVTCIDESVYYNSNDETITALQNMYKDKITWFGCKGIARWAEHKNYTTESTAHEEAFKYIKSQLGI